jgi:hypothetical protein
MPRDSLPSEKAFQTSADALLAVSGLSSLFLALLFVFNSGAFARGGAPQDNRNYNVSANRNTANANVGVTERGESVLRGRVMYADTGQPVRRARVRLLSEGTPGLRFSATNRNGEFLFRELAGGRYFAVVDSPGVISPLLYVEDSREPPFARLASGRATSDFVEVNVTGTADAFVEIRARRGGVLTGRVTYEDGTAVAGARLNVFRRRGGAWASIAGPRDTPEMAIADSRGVYRVSGLPSGEYLVRASEPRVETKAEDEEEGAHGDTSLVAAYYPDANSLRNAEALRVTAGRETADVDIVFAERALHKITGRVSARRDGKPLGGVTLNLEPKGDLHVSPSSRPGVTRWSDGEGRWSIAGVPDGVYRLSISRHPLTAEEAGAVDEDSPRTRHFVTTELEVRVEGRDVGDLSVRLAEAGAVSGKIVAADRKEPPQWARVVLVPLTMRMGAPVGAPGAQADGGTRVGASAPLVTTESLTGMISEYGGPGYGSYYEIETGEFSLWRVPPGSAYVHVLLGPEESHYVKSIVWKGVDLMREPLRARDGDEIKDVRIVLGSDAGLLSGRVLAGAGGEAAGGGIQIALVPIEALRRRITGATRAARTDAEGRFRLTAGPGEYFLAVLRERKDGGPHGLTEADIRERASTLQRVILRPKERLSIDVALPGVR